MTAPGVEWQVLVDGGATRGRKRERSCRQQEEAKRTVIPASQGPALEVGNASLPAVCRLPLRRRTSSEA